MSKENNNFFTTFREAVKFALKKERDNQQDLADKMEMNKGNLSRVLGDEEGLTAKMHGRIEKALGYKIKEQPEGWTAHKIQQNNNIDNLEKLFNALDTRTGDDNSISQFEDDPLKALEVAEKLIRGYRLLMQKKDFQE